MPKGVKTILEARSAVEGEDQALAQRWALVEVLRVGRHRSRKNTVR